MILTLVVLITLSTGGRSIQANADVIGVYKKWTAATYEVNGNLACNMWSEPEKSVGKYTRRGKVYAFVTHFPSERITAQISLDMGYPIGIPEVSVSIGKQSFVFDADGEQAYARVADTKKLLDAMRRGSSMLIKSRSTRGTDTRDSFSLIGFTAALKQIDRSCNV